MTVSYNIKLYYTGIKMIDVRFICQHTKYLLCNFMLNNGIVPVPCFKLYKIMFLNGQVLTEIHENSCIY